MFLFVVFLTGFVDEMLDIDFFTTCFTDDVCFTVDDLPLHEQAITRFFK